MEIHDCLAAVQEKYWCRFEETRASIRELRFEINEDNLVSLLNYMENHSSWDGRHDDDAILRVAMDLHENEAKARNELMLNWSRLQTRSCGNQGMLAVVRWYSWHSRCRDNQKHAYRTDILAITDTSRERLFHADFHQTRTLPLGPREGAKWWYANARLSLNLLTVSVSGAHMGRGTYFTFFERLSGPHA